MSGEIIYRAEQSPREHECAPGWGFEKGMWNWLDANYGDVYQCDCGKTWVARPREPKPGEVARHYRIEWRPETQRARRKREGK